jgi:hypothetical protein
MKIILKKIVKNCEFSKRHKLFQIKNGDIWVKSLINDMATVVRRSLKTEKLKKRTPIF